MLIALSVYAVVALIVLVACLFIGFMTKVDLIGMNIKVGVVNSIILSIFWPLFLIGAIAGWIFDVVTFVQEI